MDELRDPRKDQACPPAMSSCTVTGLGHTSMQHARMQKCPNASTLGGSAVKEPLAQRCLESCPRRPVVTHGISDDPAWPPAKGPQHTSCERRESTAEDVCIRLPLKPGQCRWGTTPRRSWVGADHIQTQYESQTKPALRTISPRARRFRPVLRGTHMVQLQDYVLFVLRGRGLQCCRHPWVLERFTEQKRTDWRNSRGCMSHHLKTHGREYGHFSPRVRTSS